MFRKETPTKILEGNQQFWKETKTVILEGNLKINFGRKPNILARKQIFREETQTKLLEGNQN